MAEEKKTCFIIMPISTPEAFLDDYRDGEEHFKHVLECLLVPSVETAGYKAIPPMAKGSDLIQAEIIRNLEESDIVLCDMSCLNPNVFFEFGIRTSLNKPVCVVKDGLTEKVPFDTAMLNYQEYSAALEPWELDVEVKKIAEHIKEAGKRSKGENTLWKYFGFKSAAHPYAGETGAEAKIDYLTLQMDSLRQQVSGMQQYPNQSSGNTTPAKSSHLDSMREVSNIFTPKGVEIVKFLKSHKGGYVGIYEGDLDDQGKATLLKNVSNLTDDPIRLIRIDDEITF